MPAVFTAKDVEALIAQGGDPASLPADAILTPSAKDALRDFAGAKRPAANPDAASAAPGKLLNSKSAQSELEALFNSPYCANLKDYDIHLESCIAGISRSRRILNCTHKM